MNKVLGLIALALLFWSVRARAEEGPAVEAANFSIHVRLGVGGTVDAISRATVVQSGTASSESADSGPRISYGFGAQYTVPLSHYFALGAAVGYLSWRGARSAIVGPRNWLADFSLLPEGRWKVADSMLLYATVPLGVSLDVLKEVGSWPSESSVDEGPSNPALGWLIGGLVGARFHVTNWMGLFAELGYVYRHFSHELSVFATTPFGAPTRERLDVTIALGQFALNVGMCVFF